MDAILKYFPDLTNRQLEQFEVLIRLYPEWNAKINVISRRDIDNLEVHHILHSLAIAKFMTPAPGTRILDLGTGGGFPGVPLAIIWPECGLHLIDRVGKKIRVASEIAAAAGLTNVTFQHGDSGECRSKFDYVVSRAVTELGALIPLVTKNVTRTLTPGNKLHQGLVVLKGGDLAAETESARRACLEVPLTDWFTEPFFETKKLIYTPL